MNDCGAGDAAFCKFHPGVCDACREAASKKKDLVKRNCGDCDTKPGELHKDGCDVERCMLCGGQSISCPCIYEVNGMSYSDLEEEHPDIYKNGPTDEMYPKLDAAIEKVGGREPWSGEWPGYANARDLGLWCKWVEGRGWVKCTARDEGARPDLNALAMRVWSPAKRKFV